MGHRIAPSGPLRPPAPNPAHPSQRRDPATAPRARSRSRDRLGHGLCRFAEARIPPPLRHGTSPRPSRRVARRAGRPGPDRGRDPAGSGPSTERPRTGLNAPPGSCVPPAIQAPHRCRTAARLRSPPRRSRSLSHKRIPKRKAAIAAGSVVALGAAALLLPNANASQDGASDEAAAAPKTLKAADASDLASQLAGLLGDSFAGSYYDGDKKQLVV